MTSQAVGEHLQLLFVMGLGVTFTAIRNLPVLLMAHCTGHLTVFTGRPLPLGKYSIVTSAAVLHLCVGSKSDLQRSMHASMTRRTFLHCLALVVAIMTFCAGRDITVLFMMAALAVLFRMSTRVRVKLLDRARMTICASAAKTVHRRNIKWGMRVFVAAAAVDLLGAMRLTMAA